MSATGTKHGDGLKILHLVPIRYYISGVTTRSRRFSTPAPCPQPFSNRSNCAIDMYAVQQDVDAWRKVKAYDDANKLHA